MEHKLVDALLAEAYQRIKLLRYQTGNPESQVAMVRIQEARWWLAESCLDTVSMDLVTGADLKLPEPQGPGAEVTP